MFGLLLGPLRLDWITVGSSDFYSRNYNKFYRLCLDYCWVIRLLFIENNVKN